MLTPVQSTTSEVGGVVQVKELKSFPVSETLYLHVIACPCWTDIGMSVEFPVDSTTC